MKKSIYILLFSAINCLAFSQTFEKDMETVYKNFVSASKIAYNIKYVLKENHNDNSRIISQNTGRYIKSKSKCISQYATKYTLTVPGEILMVDKDEKFIRVKKQAGDDKKDPDFMSQLKEYNKGIDKVTRLTTNKKDVITYNVQLKNIALYGISRYEISINTKTFYMEQMTLFYKQPLKKDPQNNIQGTEVPRLEIIFSDFNNQKIYNEAELETGFYYTKDNKKLSPTANFKNYDVKEIF
ncbi:MAG: hypothetical protein K0S32_1166 [Bacteroidetes bacterium]|jgi:hypothetical protein|nr:hypothetical protein [Bacteroidota bacterium]